MDGARRDLLLLYNSSLLHRMALSGKREQSIKIHTSTGAGCYRLYRLVSQCFHAD